MSATVTFGSEGYTVDGGADFPIGAYIHTDAGAGNYYITIAYDPAVLTYVSGADAVDTQNGVLTLSGAGGDTEIKYWLTFRAKGAGDSSIAVSNASINLPGDEGAYEAVGLAAAPIHVEGTAEEEQDEEEEGAEAEEVESAGVEVTGTTAGILHEEARSEESLRTPEFPPDLPQQNTQGDAGSRGELIVGPTEPLMISGEIETGTEEAYTTETETETEVKEHKTSIFFNSYIVLLLGFIGIIVAANVVVFSIVKLLKVRKARKRKKQEDEVRVEYDEDTDLEFIHFDEEPWTEEEGESDATQTLDADGSQETPGEGDPSGIDISKPAFIELIKRARKNTAETEAGTVAATGTVGVATTAAKPLAVYEAGTDGVISLSEFRNPPVIDVRDVTMEFHLSSGETSGLKDFLIQLLKREIRYRRLYALYHVSFSIQKGEVIGIIGTNGSGKSTLLKIISGALKPTAGEVKVDRRKVQLLTLGTGFDMELTAHENVYLNGSIIGYTREFLDEHYDEIVAFAELSGFMEEKVKNFSSGMVSRLGFAIATAGNAAEILILDEVLSVGDEFFRKKSLARISEMIHGGSTVLMVSHGMDTILQHCTRTIWIEKGELKMDGAPKVVCKAYREFGKNNKQ